jgi:cytochrome c oxidase assembly factor CtaG
LLPFRSGTLAAFAFIIHTSVVWFWHAPSAYAFAVSHDLAFWVMQLNLAASALVLWLCVLSPGTPLGASIAVLLGSVMQMGLLGALITFALHAGIGALLALYGLWCSRTGYVSPARSLDLRIGAQWQNYTAVIGLIALLLIHGMTWTLRS